MYQHQQQQQQQYPYTSYGCMASSLSSSGSTSSCSSSGELLLQQHGNNPGFTMTNANPAAINITRNNSSAMHYHHHFQPQQQQQQQPTYEMMMMMNFNGKYGNNNNHQFNQFSSPLVTCVPEPLALAQTQTTNVNECYEFLTNNTNTMINAAKQNIFNNQFDSMQVCLVLSYYS